jgi:hypothetical protein
MTRGDAQAAFFRRRYDEFLSGTDVEPVKVALLLLDLSKCLAEVHRESVVILIDGYDAPAVAAYRNGAIDDRLWYENFLSAGLKSNPYLHRAVLLGSLPVAAPNNVAIYPSHFSGFDNAFGFTDSEVEQLLLGTGMWEQSARVRHECGGHIMGPKRTAFHCPGAVMAFLANSGRELRFPPPEGLHLRNPEVVDVVSRLLRGESSTLRSPALGVRVEDPSSDDVLWRLVLLGYLTAEEIRRGGYDYPEFRVTIPNAAMTRSLASMLGADHGQAR